MRKFLIASIAILLSKYNTVNYQLMATHISPRQPRRKRTRLDPRRQPTQSRSCETVEALFEASAQVFEEEGFLGATTNRIAERAGISIGTLYQYYPSKEALAVALLMRHLETGQRLIEELGRELAQRPRNLRDTLQLLVDSMLQLHSDRPRLQHLLLEEAPRTPQIEAKMQRLDENAVIAVSKLLPRFDTVRRPLDRTTVYMVVQTIEHMTHEFAAHPPHGVLRADFTDELVSMLLGYLTSSLTDSD